MKFVAKPAGHGVHTGWLATCANDPMAHDAQDDAPKFCCARPIGQPKHASAPVTLDAEPGLHCVHAAWPGLGLA